MGVDPFVGQIGMVAFNYAPRGYAFCNGQILALRTNTALFSLLGTYYGGDGRTTFALPDLQGRAPMQQGSGAGLTPRSLGETGGNPTVTLMSGEMPLHKHSVVTTNASSIAGNVISPAGAYPASGPSGVQLYSTLKGNDLMLPPVVNVGTSTDITGGNQPHNNMQPYLAINFIIALQGVFPSRY